MGRTTISRSDLAPVVLALAISVAPAAAQDTLMLGEGAPDVHVVEPGETLWGLAEHYLGDPFLWPEIYRLNTLVVEDPHWIFPGEELRLRIAEADMPVMAAEPEAPDTMAVEVEEQPMVVERPQVAQGGPPRVPESTMFQSQSVRGGPGITFGGIRDDSFRPVRRSEFYAAGFLTEGEALPWGDVVGAVGTRAGTRASTATSAVVFEEIEVQAPVGAEYQVGDSLLLVTISRQVRDWGHVIVPSGVARVESVSGRGAIARILMQFDVVLSGQSALPLEAFRDPGSARPVAIENGAWGKVIEPRGQDPVPNQQDIVFIDLGREDGVVPGDVFEVLRRKATQTVAESPWEAVGVLRIVHVRESSASGLVVQIFHNGIRPGADVRLVRKMPG